MFCQIIYLHILLHSCWLISSTKNYYTQWRVNSKLWKKTESRKGNFFVECPFAALFSDTSAKLWENTWQIGILIVEFAAY